MNQRVLVRQCRECHRSWIFRLPPEAVEKWESGKPTLFALPMLTFDEREILVKGVCTECLDKMFKND